MGVLSESTLSLSKDKFKQFIKKSSAKESSKKRYWRGWRKYHREQKEKPPKVKKVKKPKKKPPKVSYNKYNISFRVKLMEENTGETWKINYAYKSGNIYLSYGQELNVAQEIEDYYNRGKQDSRYKIKVLELEYLATYDRTTGKRAGIISPKGITII